MADAISLAIVRRLTVIHHFRVSSDHPPFRDKVLNVAAWQVVLCTARWVSEIAVRGEVVKAIEGLGFDLAKPRSSPLWRVEIAGVVIGYVAILLFPTEYGGTGCAIKVSIRGAYNAPLNEAKERWLK